MLKVLDEQYSTAEHLLQELNANIQNLQQMSEDNDSSTYKVVDQLANHNSIILGFRNRLLDTSHEINQMTKQKKKIKSMVEGAAKNSQVNDALLTLKEHCNRGLEIEQMLRKVGEEIHEENEKVASQLAM